MIVQLKSIARQTSDGVYITVRAKPATAKEKALRLVEVTDGKAALEVSVKAAAHDGKANKALCERLAQVLEISKSRVSLCAGDKARIKTFFIEGDVEALLQKLEQALG